MDRCEASKLSSWSVCPVWSVCVWRETFSVQKVKWATAVNVLTRTGCCVARWWGMQTRKGEQANERTHSPAAHRPHAVGRASSQNAAGCHSCGSCTETPDPEGRNMNKYTWNMARENTCLSSNLVLNLLWICTKRCMWPSSTPHLQTNTNSSSFHRVPLHLPSSNH